MHLSGRSKPSRASALNVQCDRLPKGQSKRPQGFWPLLTGHILRLNSQKKYSSLLDIELGSGSYRGSSLRSKALCMQWINERLIWFPCSRGKLTTFQQGYGFKPNNKEGWSWDIFNPTTSRKVTFSLGAIRVVELWRQRKIDDFTRSALKSALRVTDL